MKLNACLVGQVAAHLMASNAFGKVAEDFEVAHRQIANWLAGGDEMPDWPGLEALEPVRSKSGHHAAILLPFEAAAEAAADAHAKVAVR